MKKVLVVEDDVDAGASLVEVLEDQGFVCSLALSGSAGLLAADELRPDVVLLDIGLPDLSGYTVARQLRERGLPLWIVAITGHCEGLDLVRSRGAGIDVHLPKPLRVRELVGLLEGLRSRRGVAAA